MLLGMGAGIEKGPGLCEVPIIGGACGWAPAAAGAIGGGARPCAAYAACAACAQAMACCAVATPGCRAACCAAS